MINGTRHYYSTQNLIIVTQINSLFTNYKTTFTKKKKNTEVSRTLKLANWVSQLKINKVLGVIALLVKQYVLEGKKKGCVIHFQPSSLLQPL